MNLCTCEYIYIGQESTGVKSWNSQCDVHGIDSPWYNDPVQITKRKNKKRVDNA